MFKKIVFALFFLLNIFLYLAPEKPTNIAPPIGHKVSELPKNSYDISYLSNTVDTSSGEGWLGLFMIVLFWGAYITYKIGKR